MKYDKFYKNLENFISKQTLSEVEDNRLSNSLLFIKDLVDKETPMRPVKNKYGDYDCRKCNRTVWEFGTSDKKERCDTKRCGQVVDWSNDD